MPLVCHTAAASGLANRAALPLQIEERMEAAAAYDDDSGLELLTARHRWAMGALAAGAFGTDDPDEIAVRGVSPTGVMGPPSILVP